LSQVLVAAGVVDDVGTLISLQHHRTQRAQVAGRPRPVDCWFDLADPACYLALERVERLPAAIAWRPATLATGPRWAPARFEARARELRLPLVWPERPGAFPRAMRAAAYACEQHRGGSAFVLAASRLAFCGGFDIDDPVVLAEAIAAAGLDFAEAMDAAREDARDAEIREAGRFLAAHGATELPALRVGRTLVHGELRVSDAAAALRGARATARRPA
jgi:2-hydroxychromene-2-carboxylate isomerase